MIRIPLYVPEELILPRVATELIFLSITLSLSINLQINRYKQKFVKRCKCDLMFVPLILKGFFLIYFSLNYTSIVICWFLWEMVTAVYIHVVVDLCSLLTKCQLHRTISDAHVLLLRSAFSFQHFLLMFFRLRSVSSAWQQWWCLSCMWELWSARTLLLSWRSTTSSSLKMMTTTTEPSAQNKW